MLRIVHRPPPSTYKPERRLWLIFFSDAERLPWWARGLAPGFRHVSAAAWYADQERWVYYNPARGGTIIEVLREDEFNGRFAQLLTDSTAVLRLPSAHARTMTARLFWCVGAIKALLGIESRALSPKALHAHLLRLGAEPVEVPIEFRKNAVPAPGRPERGCGAAASAAAG